MIRYSEKVKGNEQNYNWEVRFDSDGGYLGISQYKEEAGIERVLLSPKQVKALLEFCGLTKRATDAASPASKNGKGSKKPRR